MTYCMSDINSKWLSSTNTKTRGRQKASNVVVKRSKIDLEVYDHAAMQWHKKSR